MLSHILLQYVGFCISNNSYNSVLVICPQGKYLYFPPNLTSGICEGLKRKYVKVQGKMVHKIVFQSN